MSFEHQLRRKRSFSDGQRIAFSFSAPLRESFMSVIILRASDIQSIDGVHILKETSLKTCLLP